jgi:single-strand DNA-binding protein
MVMLKGVIVGNIGSDPEMQYSAGGSPFLRFNVASNYRVRSQDGSWSDATEWVRVTVFGKRAETLQQHLKKGTRVYCDGRLEARPWTDQQGQVRAGLELMASDVEFMSSRQGSTGDDDDQPF